MNRLVTTVGLSALAISTALALSPAAAEAQSGSINCGTTLTADTKLTSDLLDCPDNGLVIGADDITLDLNGHTVGGDGAPVASCPDGEDCDVGIDDSSGHTGVTIKGGSVQGFDVGLLLIGGSDNRVQRISSANDTSFGMIVADSTQSRLDHNSSVNDGICGIVLGDSSQMRIDHNSISGTTGYAVPVFGSSHNRFDHNLLTSDQHGFLLGSSDQNPGSDDNEIRDNRLADGPSIEVDQSSGNRVQNNSLTHPRDGILLIESSHTQVSDNFVTNAGLGFDTGGFGILLDGANDNVLQRNSLSRGKGPAIFVTSLDSPQPSNRNVVAHNVINSTLYPGILVNNNASATLLDNNTSNGNGQDGIDVESAGTTITDNSADNNHDLGIRAVPGVIDGGGNTATGNGNPAQCLNVVCK